MDFTIYNSLILAGIIQGLFLSAFILFSKKNKTRSSVYLGLLILAFTLSNLQYSLDAIGLISTFTFNIIYFPYFFLTPPFLYFFVMTFLYPKRKTKSKEKILYLPFLLFLFLAALYKIALLIPQTEFVIRAMQWTEVFVDAYGDFINIPLFLFVLVALLLNIKKFEQKQKKFDLEVIKNRLLWLKILLFFLFITTLPWIYFTIQYAIDFEILFLPLFAMVSIIIYVLGYIGIYKIGVQEERKKLRKFSKENRSFSIVEKPKNEHIASLEKLLVEERWFQDSSITLDSIANELNISKGHLSRVVNSELNISFSDYINTLRVEEAKSYLKNVEFSSYTLVAIGLEAGFNSKSTFNSAFKKIAGVTPSQFKRNHSN